MRNTRLRLVVGLVAVVSGVLPILGSGPRIAVFVAGVLLLLATASRVHARRSGDGDPRGPQDRPLWPGNPD
jgi:uncharacterized membrane protein YphA (DoxX/SURF4 family)